MPRDVESGRRYPQLLCRPDTRWPLPVAGAALGLLLFLICTPLLNEAITYLGWAVADRGVTFADYRAAARRYDNPVGMLATNLSLVLLIPLSIALTVTLHHTRPRWLLSVTGRLRWPYLLSCLLLATGVLGVTLAVSAAAQPVPGGPAAGYVTFLAIIVFTSPLQAAAEEVFFRGYLTQALGSLTASPWAAVVAPAIVFAALHGTQNLALFLNRLAFGLLAGFLVVVTGGLEAGIAAHVANNALAYTAAVLTGTVSELRGTTSLTWAAATIDVAAFALFTLAAWLLARRLQLAVTGQPSATLLRSS